MQQYFAIKKEGDILYLNKDDLNHIKNVMRMRENDNIIAVYENFSYVCQLNKDLLSCKIVDTFKTLNGNGRLIAFVPLLQDEKMSLVLQKGTELGVNEFIVVVYSHCKYKLYEKDYEKKLVRWNRIIKEACEQCYRIDKPKLEKIISSKEMTALANVNILCSLVKGNVNHISDILNANNFNDTISVAFGPEGGFSSEEEDMLVRRGFVRVSLGPNVLRTETVLIYFASVLMYLKGSVK